MFLLASLLYVPTFSIGHFISCIVTGGFSMKYCEGHREDRSLSILRYSPSATSLGTHLQSLYSLTL